MDYQLRKLKMKLLIILNFDLLKFRNGFIFIMSLANDKYKYSRLFDLFKIIYFNKVNKKKIFLNA